MNNYINKNYIKPEILPNKQQIYYDKYLVCYFTDNIRLYFKTSDIQNIFIKTICNTDYIKQYLLDTDKTYIRLYSYSISNNIELILENNKLFVNYYSYNILLSQYTELTNTVYLNNTYISNTTNNKHRHNILTYIKQNNIKYYLFIDTINKYNQYSFNMYNIIQNKQYTEYNNNIRYKTYNILV